jgi:hypothetical protein
LNAAPLREIQDWVTYYTKYWNEKKLLINQLLQEEQKMPTVSLDFQFTNSIERVWLALTDSKTLAKWVMDNDFKPVVGHKFQFRTEPNKWWNGIVDSEVLLVDEPNRLSYTWARVGSIFYCIRMVDLKSRYPLVQTLEFILFLSNISIYLLYANSPCKDFSMDKTKGMMILITYIFN